MKIYLLIILFFNYITCINIPGTYDKDMLFSSYMTQNNDMLIYNPKNSTLLKYTLNSKMPFYTKMDILNTKEFPKNSSENISKLYFHFNYINSSSINITYFNENYTSYYIYTPITKNIEYDHISFDVINKNKLILFLHPKKYKEFNSSINIVEFDFKNEEKLKIKTKYSFKSSETTNVHCVSADKNNIICGFIEFNNYFFKIYNNYITKFIFTYSLLYFSEETYFPKNVTIYYNINGFSYSPDSNTGILKENLFKLIPLSEEKIIYCFNAEIVGSYPKSIRIRCGLAQIQNNDIKANSTIDISVPIVQELNRNYIKKNSFDGVKINDKEVILSYYTNEKDEMSLNFNKYYNIFYYIKIKIKDNNKLEKESNFYNDSLSSYKSEFYSLNLLKNDEDNLVSIYILNGQAQFKEYGYSTCEDTKISLFNGDYILIKFNLYSLFGKDIIFLNKNNQKIHSIIEGNYKPINYSVIYDKSQIMYRYSYDDYDYAQNNNLKLIFTGSLMKKNLKCVN